MPEASPRILVIIVTWNKESFILNLLSSLERIHYPEESLDIVVVDNASTDNTVALLREKFPTVHIIENSANLGGTGGFNTGLAYAYSQPDGKYEYLWLLDNDVEVHPDTLAALVGIVAENSDIAIVGSTMMQLNRPWRINEMGAFVDMGCGSLLLNRHHQDIKGLQGKTVAELQAEPLDLCEQIEWCQPYMDVEYVAAASMLVRASLAREMGLWDDYFIHFDDVEWCQRFIAAGHRVAVSARSVIWHLSAEYKMPTWVLYYDNRNVLSMIGKHSVPVAVKKTKKLIKKKSLYYYLLGKNDLSRLHLQGIEDFAGKEMGRKDILLDPVYHTHEHLGNVLRDTSVRKVLIPFTVNLQALGLQEIFVQVMRERPDLQVCYLVPPPCLLSPDEPEPGRQLPREQCLVLPKGRVRRLLRYLRMKDDYDLLLQSDYRIRIPFILFARRTAYVNYEGLNIRTRPSLSEIFAFVRKLLR